MASGHLRKRPLKNGKHSEVEILIEKVKDTDLEVPICLEVALGLRRGELLELKWEDIDILNNTVVANIDYRSDKYEIKGEYVELM